MKMKPLVIKRYLYAVLSMYVMTLGISLVVRSNMGCVPLLSPAYVLGCMPGQWLTSGILVFVMYLLMLLVRFIVQRPALELRSLAMVPMGLLFCLFLDFNMWLLHFMQWDDSLLGIVLRVMQVVVGSLIVALGYLVYKGVGVRALGDDLTACFSSVLKLDFRLVRLAFDVLFFLLAIVFSVYYFGVYRWDLIGVGTILSLFIEWSVWSYLSDRAPDLFPLTPKAYDTMASEAKENNGADAFPLVVTIARTHGSGGHEIGLKVAERLAINFYDKEIITATADKLGISPEDVSDADQKYSIRHFGKSGSVYEAQSQIIRDAARESCVIIGRCADYVLRDRPYCLNIFVRCDEDYAVTMIRNKDNLGETQAREVIRLKNAAREKHYNHYTGQKWQDPLHYDLVINTAKIGIESAVDIVCNAVENILKEER